MTRPLLAVAAFLILAGTAQAATKLQESEARNATMKAAGTDAAKARESTDDLVSFQVAGCTRKTRMRFSCRYTLAYKPLGSDTYRQTCARTVRVTKTAAGAVKTRTTRKPCEPFDPSGQTR